MNRVPYRRVTPTRNSDNHNNKITVGETMVVQLIICTVLMVAVLMASFTEIGPMTIIRGGLQQVLQGATTAEEFTAEVRHFRREWLGFNADRTTEELDLPLFYIPTQNEAFDLQPPPMAYEEHSNPQTPGPLVSPGLWD
ncbi:MAG: preprotein translocase subunit SecG [Firmicutes bacterium]|nr:preprotein translocase subunit SecG [Bacillota bacterium]